MAPLPVESTARYVLHYTSGGNEHTQTYRYDSPPSPAAFGTFADELWTAVGPMLFEATVTDVWFYPNGSTIGNPVAAPAVIGNIYGAGSPGNNLAALFVNFVARSSGGRRVRLSFFSPIGTDASWRFYGSEEPHVADGVSLLEGETALCGIDGTPLLWKPYANNGYNAYWQRELRS